MKTFPSKLTPKNVPRFSQFAQERLACYLRKEIYEFMLQHHEKLSESHFDLTGFAARYSPVPDELLDKIVEELEESGWICKRMFGNTALCISNVEPQSYWDEI